MTGPPPAGQVPAAAPSWVHTLRLHGVVLVFTATAFLGQWISLAAPAVVVWMMNSAPWAVPELS